MSWYDYGSVYTYNDVELSVRSKNGGFTHADSQKRTKTADKNGQKQANSAFYTKFQEVGTSSFPFFSWMRFDSKLLGVTEKMG